MSSSTYTVAGMTCGGCANTVKTEISKVSGVTDVAVDVASGKVTVTTTGPLDDALVQDAVENAGYELVRN